MATGNVRRMTPALRWLMGEHAGKSEAPVDAGDITFRHQVITREGRVCVCLTALPADRCACGAAWLVDRAVLSALYSLPDPDAPVPYQRRPRQEEPA